jgi:hypothetical protein
MTAQQFQQKQAQRLKAAIPDVKSGVNAVQVNPAAQAAAAADQWQASVASETVKAKFIKGLGRVDLATWKANTAAKADRISVGIDAAAKKVTDFATAFLPFVYSAAAEVKAQNPGADLESGIARSSAMIRKTAAFTR